MPLEGDAKRAYQREWCRRKRKEGTLKQTTREKKLAIINEAKEGPCTICQKEFHPCCMDFHHKNPKEKKYEISDFHRYGIKYLQEEIDKCVPLCACCHRLLHKGLVELPLQFK